MSSASSILSFRGELLVSPRKAEKALNNHKEKNMNNSTKNINSVRFIEKSNSLLLKTPSGETFFLNKNLVLHELELPYTKKDGTKVSTKEIKESKALAQEKYLQAIKNNKQKASA